MGREQQRHLRPARRSSGWRALVSVTLVVAACGGQDRNATASADVTPDPGTSAEATSDGIDVDVDPLEAPGGRSLGRRMPVRWP